jgi:hypothetical protein
MRDPFNLFASRIKQYEGRTSREEIIRKTRVTVDLWKNHALEFIGKTRFLPNLLTVNYNDGLGPPSEFQQRARSP